MAFMDSQPQDELGAAKALETDDMATLDFDEFIECLARAGIDKYRPIKRISPADAVKGMFQNILDEATPDEVVVAATYITCERYDAEAEAEVLEGETVLDLRERPFEAGELRLLVGLLKNNTELEELDLTATDIECDSASDRGTLEVQALVTIMESSTALTTLRMAYNPGLDEAAKAFADAKKVVQLEPSNKAANTLARRLQVSTTVLEY